MDAIYETVSRLYAHEISMKEIARHNICSTVKAKKILITTGQYSSDKINLAMKLKAEGKTNAEIAKIMGCSPKNVSAMLPYEKCMYNAKNPSINALKIRKCREKRTEQETENDRTASN